MKIPLLDKKQSFIKRIVDHPETMHNVYFGMKAAPLTIAHENILKYLVQEFLKYDNVHLRIGIADSMHKEDFKIIDMVKDYVKKEFPDKIKWTTRATAKSREEENWWAEKIRVVDQHTWQGLYSWLKENDFKPHETLVCVGEDEWKHIEDDDGVWLNVLQFIEDYDFHLVKNRDDNVSATEAREIFYRDPDVDYFYVKKFISKWTYDWIKSHGTFWQLKDNYRAEENKFIETYDASKFDRPSVTVDNIAWARKGNDKFIVLIRRKGHPYKNYWALPGGFLDVKSDASLEDAAKRELFEETNLSPAFLQGGEIQNDPDKIITKQFKAYSDKGTDPRTRIVDVVFTTLFSYEHLDSAFPGDDASDVAIFNVNELPKMGFNHKQIIREFFETI